MGYILKPNSGVAVDNIPLDSRGAELMAKLIVERSPSRVFECSIKPDFNIAQVVNFRNDTSASHSNALSLILYPQIFTPTPITAPFDSVQPQATW